MEYERRWNGHLPSHPKFGFGFSKTRFALIMAGQYSWRKGVGTMKLSPVSS